MITYHVTNGNATRHYPKNGHRVTTGLPRESVRDTRTTIL
jgi:hypothetical protein